MISDLLLALDGLQDVMTVIFLSWARIWVVFKVVPIFGAEGLLPALARNSITLSLALIVYPLIHSSYVQANDPTMLWLVLTLIKEVFIGFLIGFCVATIFWKISGVGFIIDNQRGATMASLVNPAMGDQDSPFGIYLSQVFMAAFVAVGGLSLLTAMIYQSYSIWPPFVNNLIFEESYSLFFVGLLDEMLYVILFVAGPAIICMFLAEFGLGLVGRFAPQLNVFFLAMPIKSAIAIAMLALSVFLVLEFFLTDVVDDSFFTKLVLQMAEIVK